MSKVDNIFGMKTASLSECRAKDRPLLTVHVGVTLVSLRNYTAPDKDYRSGILPVNLSIPELDGDSFYLAFVLAFDGDLVVAYLLFCTFCSRRMFVWNPLAQSLL